MVSPEVEADGEGGEQVAVMTDNFTGVCVHYSSVCSSRSAV